MCYCLALAPSCIEYFSGEAGCNAAKASIAANKAMFDTHEVAPHFTQIWPNFEKPTVESGGFDRPMFE